MFWPVIVRNTIHSQLAQVEQHLRHRSITDILDLNRKPDPDVLDLSIISIGDDGFDVAMRNTRPGPSFISVEPFNLTIMDSIFEHQIMRVAVPATAANTDMIRFGIRYDPGNVDSLLNMIETSVHAHARPKVSLAGDVTVKLFAREAHVKVQRANLPTPRVPDFMKFAKFVTNPKVKQVQNGSVVNAAASVDLSLPYTIRVWLGEIGLFVLHNGKEFAEVQVDRVALHPGTTHLKATGHANLAMLQTDKELTDAIDPKATSDLPLTLRGRPRLTNPIWLNEFLGREQNITIPRSWLTMGAELVQQGGLA
ncbi:hypothetical protein BCR37DRAFT_59018 [Protomyces lactucae-debilis]|uniref:Uncharacterized protein n=1 Tax=Protomyces lactucae-debilis TaxID=2754530 RepID=A0A1Y2FAM1_PROLT|nr:uncharacterized protein BCR37DRAFT_59018 [Protomyces lactucae-debilis]ORY80950.1 hypothetical protein BCR37DRAFT_59018 [Protomyces lactucae-debilis]